MQSEVLSISVVLPVLNEEKDIGSLLSSLIEQDPVPGGAEIIVADGGSTDATVSIARRFSGGDPNVRVITNPGRRSSAGRNVGASVAFGRYVLFLDGHCELPRRDYLLRTWQIFTTTKADCLCRPQPLKQMEQGAWSAAISAARHSPLGHNPGSGIYGSSSGFTDPRSAGAAYARECLHALGGYDERFDACEDVEFNHRVAIAGYRSYIHPDLTVHYRARSTLAALLRQMFRYGRGRARLWAKHPTIRPWHLQGATAYLIMIVLLSAFTTARWTAIGMIPAGLLLGATAVEAFRIAGCSIQAGRVLGAFLTIYAGLCIGFWRGLLDIPTFRHQSANPNWRGHRASVS